MDESELIKTLMDFRASAAEWELTEFGIITEVRKKIRKNLEHDDILIAIQRLPTIRKLK